MDSQRGTPPGLAMMDKLLTAPGGLMALPHWLWALTVRMTWWKLRATNERPVEELSLSGQRQVTFQK
jgi:hypothetical protein